jgi:hypothetical protein
MKQPRTRIHNSGDTVRHHTAARHDDEFARLLRAEFTKAGIILEPDTNQGTAYAAVMVTGAHGVRHARIAERQRIAREMPTCSATGFRSSASRPARWR